MTYMCPLTYSLDTFGGLVVPDSVFSASLMTPVIQLCSNTITGQLTLLTILSNPVGLLEPVGFFLPHECSRRCPSEGMITVM